MKTRKLSNLFGLLNASASASAVKDNGQAVRRGTAAIKMPGVPDNLPETFTMEAEGSVEFLESAGDGEGEGGSTVPKFSMVAYRGGKMRPAGWGGDVVLDLSGTKIAKGKRPALLNHDAKNPVGHFDDGGIQNTGKVIKAAGVLSVESDDQRKIIQSSRDGFPWKSSIGAAPDWSKVEYIEAGDSRHVNGKVQRGPFIYVGAALVHEVSFVTIAGDDTSSAAVKANRSREGSNTMNFEQWLEAAGWDIETLTEKQHKSLRAAYKAEMQASGNGSGSETDTEPTNTGGNLNAGGQANQEDGQDELSLADQLRAEGAAEVERQGRLRGLFAQAQLGDDRRTELHAQAVRENWNADKVELEILRASRADVNNGGQFAIHAVNKNLTAGALVASLSQSLGVPEEIAARGVSEKDMNTANQADNRNLTLHALMDVVILQANGYGYTGSRKSNDFIKAAANADRMLCAKGFSSLNASGNTTISLTGILGNVANKSLIAAFESVETVYQMLCRRSTHSDFKSHTRLRLDINGGYKKVGADGQLKHSKMSEASFSNKLDTYGTMLTLTRQDMINDDLDALAQIATQLGIMAGTVMEEEFWKLVLADPNSFFSVGNKNLTAGTDYALSIDGLTKGEAAFSDRVKSDGTPILLSPKYLVTGSTLKTTARELYDETKVNVSTTANKAQFASNPHAGSYQPVSSSYMNNPAIRDRAGDAISGQSTTKWMLLADPRVRAAFVVASLNGNDKPTIESDESAFNTLGMQWRGFHDFGFGNEEPEAVMQFTGVA